MDVVRATQRDVDQAGRDRVIRQAIDEDDAAQVAVVRIGFQDHGPIQLQRAHPDLVEVQGLGGRVLERVDIHLVAEPRHRRRRHGRAHLHQVGATLRHRLLVHPDEGGFELVGDGRGRVGGGDDVAPAHVDVVGQRQRHALAGHRDRLVAVGRDDARDARLASRRQHAHAIARAHGAAHHGAGIATELGVRAGHQLDRHAEGAGRRLVADLDGLQMTDQTGAVVPGHGGAMLDDVVAVDRARRNGRDVRETHARGKLPIVGGDGLEAVAGVPDQIHLVHREHDVADAEERGQVAVTAGLREHALARIDEDHGEVRRRRGRDHVAGVLLVPRGVGHDELAALRREEPIGHVDGDALHPLRHQPIDQEGEVEARPRASPASWNRPRGRPAGRRRAAATRRAVGRSGSTCRRRRSRRS